MRRTEQTASIRTEGLTVFGYYLKLWKLLKILDCILSLIVNFMNAIMKTILSNASKFESTQNNDFTVSNKLLAYLLVPVKICC